MNDKNGMDYIQDRNWGCRISEYIFRGMRMVTLENEVLRISVIADKGTDIYEFQYKPSGIDFMYRSPFVLRNPGLFKATLPTGEGAFHDNYHGGWQEILPTGGIPTMVKGAKFGYHGEVSLIPWDYSVNVDTPECVEVLFTTRTYRTPFYIEKSLRLERYRPVLYISEKLINEGMEEMSLMWGHHPSIGRNFIEKGCVIDLPPCKIYSRPIDPTSRLIESCGDIWPNAGSRSGIVDLSKIPSREECTHDLSFLYDMEDSWYAIRNPRLKLSFGLRWSRDIWPYLWFWQVYGGAYGYGFYGRSYNIALEPFSSFPDSYNDAMKAGRLISMQPGESKKARLTASIFDSEQIIRGIDENGDPLVSVF